MTMTTPILRLMTKSRMGIIMNGSLRYCSRHHSTTPLLRCCRTMSTAAHYTPRNDVHHPWTTSPTTSSSASGKSPTRARANAWNRPSQRQQQQQQGAVGLQQQPPPRYNSLIHIPDTVSLSYPDDSSHSSHHKSLNCADFFISEPGKGGHVLLGRNGSGKSLFIQYLSNPEMFLLDDNNNDDDNWQLLHPSEIAYVSFESHLQILTRQPHLTVHDAITGGDGNLSKAAQYLVVRFGLKPLLHRTVSTLSTGEIRKCLLVSALSQEPRLLILENAFDGLDVQSRCELKSIVSKTMKGLGNSGKLLVTSVKAENVAPAQVFMSTHRPEEIDDSVSTVSLILPPDHTGENDKSSNNNNNNNLVTIQRPIGWSNEQLMYAALGLDKDHNKNKKNWAVLAPWEIDDSTLPTVQELQDKWGGESQNQATTTTETAASNPLMTLDNVKIRRRRDGMTRDEVTPENEFATLLQPLSWEIRPGERWLIAGGNGAGKSTLSRFLLHHQEEEDAAMEAENDKDTTCDLTSGTYSKEQGATIGWVSTESHLGHATAAGSNEDANSMTAWDVITHNGMVPESVASQFVSWVFGSSNHKDAHESSMLRDTPFEELSQGQQKLALLVSAVALRPKVLILDEPLQGLDWVNRCRVLAFLERLCQATDTSLIFITHYQEEWIPSISHVLHLDQGRALYQGPKSGYNPAKLEDDGEDWL